MPQLPEVVSSVTTKVVIIETNNNIFSNTLVEIIFCNWERNGVDGHMYETFLSRIRMEFSSLLSF